MASLNKVELIGYVGRDPEMKYSQSGMAICKFSIATNDFVRKGETETAWHNVVSFGKQAEVIEQYLKKGSLIFIEGRIAYSEYENKSGQKIKVTDIILANFQFLDQKSGGQVTPGPEQLAQAESEGDSSFDQTPF